MFLFNRLMATLRQKGAPTIFTTLSSAEYEWDDLALHIFETITKSKSSLQFIREKSVAWRNKLMSENVIQSTIHFAKRTDKIMALLQKEELFTHLGVQYRVESYFYRVEFQVNPFSFLVIHR